MSARVHRTSPRTPRDRGVLRDADAARRRFVCQELGGDVEDCGPAASGPLFEVRVRGGNLVRQRQLAPVRQWTDVDRDLAAFARVFLHEKRERDAMRPIELDVCAGVRHVFAVTPIDDRECAAHASVDLASHDLSGRCGEEKPRRFFRVEKCVVHTLRLGGESMSDADGSAFARRSSPVLVSSWIASWIASWPAGVRGLLPAGSNRASAGATATAPAVSRSTPRRRRAAAYRATGDVHARPRAAAPVRPVREGGCASRPS